MKKLLTAIAAAILAGTAQSALITYENTISSPADGGGGPALWYRNANSRVGTGLVKMASVGSEDNEAFRLGGQTHTDFFGNPNMAFGLASDETQSAAISNSTNLFMTGAQGSVSFLFKTGSDVTYTTLQSLFRQGSGFELILFNDRVRLSYTNEGSKFLNIGPSLVADTWYYTALKWDTTKLSDDMTWFLGVAGSDSLASGTINIDSAGSNTSIEIAGRTNTSLFMDPMQQFAVWQRELSDASIEQQFAAIPEPSTLALFSIALAVSLLARRRTLFR